MRYWFNILLFSFFAIVLCSCSSSLHRAAMQNGGSYIDISKETMTLTLYDAHGNQLYCFGIACGAAYGDKQMEGDMKTPEGEFYVSELKDASHWTHDFGDGKGEIKGAYGSHFIRLATPPHTGIGIHGTHAPSSIGTRASEGCVRLKNRNLKRLVPYIYLTMPVTITPSQMDIAADN